MTDNKTKSNPSESVTKALADLSQGIVLRTILYSLSDDDARTFIALISDNKIDDAQKLINEKIPDLEEKSRRQAEKRAQNIIKRIYDY
jgi:hypothetical protein